MNGTQSSLDRIKLSLYRDKLVGSIRDARHFIEYVVERVIVDRCIESAAALTFTTLLALVPMFTVLYAILAMVPSLGELGDQFQNWLFQHFVPASGEEVQAYLKEFSVQASRLTKFGVIFLFVTAIMMMKRIEKSFNLIWRVPEPRKGVIGFMRYWAVLSLGPILVGLGLAITSYLASLKVVSNAVALLGIQKFGLMLLPFLLSWIAFTLVYIVVPNCAVPIKRSIQGGLAAAFAFECAKRGFTIFVTNFGSYQMVYGAFAALPLFLLWLYLSWIILLLGAVITRALSVYRHSSKTMDPLQGLLSVIHLLWKAQQSGETLSDQRVLKALPQLSPEQWQNYREKLRSASLIERTDQGTYLLSKDLWQVSLLDILRTCGFYVDYGVSLDASPKIDYKNAKLWASVDEPQDWYGQVRERLQSISTVQSGELSHSLAALFGEVSKSEDCREKDDYLT